jgi:hypothetical protein
MTQRIRLAAAAFGDDTAVTSPVGAPHLEPRVGGTAGDSLTAGHGAPEGRWSQAGPEGDGVLVSKCRAKHGVRAGELVWGDVRPRCSLAQSFVDTRERAGRGEFDVSEH